MTGTRFVLVTAISLVTVFVSSCGEVGPGPTKAQTCGNSPLNTSVEFCYEEEIYIKCPDKEYNPLDSFCYENSLYPKCKNKEGKFTDYNPFEYGCFEDKLYPNCRASGVLGVCVYNGNLRCNQTGSGNTMVKPYPGMQCLDPNPDDPGANLTDRGKITGKIGTYNVVQIGKQVWMAENLKENLPEPAEYYEDILVGNEVERRYYERDYKIISGEYLYNWATAMKLPYRIQRGGNTAYYNYNASDSYKKSSYLDRLGLCPRGWRVPSSAEWRELIDYAGGSSIAGGRLKATSGWGNGNGTDSYGFNAKPQWFDGDYATSLSNLDAYGAFWWTSTELEQNVLAYFWYVTSSDTEARQTAYEKGAFRFSVRCLLNVEE